MDFQRFVRKENGRRLFWNAIPNRGRWGHGVSPKYYERKSSFFFVSSQQSPIKYHYVLTRVIIVYRSDCYRCAFIPAGFADDDVVC